MRKLFQLTSLMMAIPLILTTSCVDEEYDPNKIDKEIVVLKGLSTPIGNMAPISISDFLKLDENTESLIQKDAKGDLSLVYNSESPISASFTIPEIDFSIGENKVERRVITMNMPSQITGLNTSLLQQVYPDYYNKKLSYKELSGSDLSIQKPIEMREEITLSSYIADIKEIVVESEFQYNFNLITIDNNGDKSTSLGGCVYIQEGFTLDFPDWMTFEKTDAINTYVIEHKSDNRNIIRFTKDTPISISNPLIFRLIVNKIDVPSEFLVNGGKDENGKDCLKLNIDAKDEKNMIIISGDIYTKPSDYTQVPKQVLLDMDVTFGKSVVKSALVSLNVNETLEEKTFEIPGVSDILSGDNVVIDLYDPSFTFDIVNRTPLDINVSAQMFTYKNDKELLNMYFTENNVNAPINIPKDFNGRITISRRGEGDAFANPALGTLFRTIPDKLAIKNINISAGRDYISIVPGNTLECSVGYGVKAPLAFGPDFLGDFEYDIKDIGLEFEAVEMNNIILTLETVNTIPLSLELAAIGYSTDSQNNSNTIIGIEGGIAAGSLTSPTTSAIRLIYKNDTNKIDNLKFKFKASCPSEYQGVCINENQGVEIRKIYITLPDGITIDLDDYVDNGTIE